MSSKLSAFLLGATGEVGKELVKELAANGQISKVTLIGRKNVELPKAPEYEKFEQKIIDFEQLANNENTQQLEEIFKGHDTGFCSLGTTRGKAGVDGFIRVDHDYIMSAAKLAKSTGTQHFSLVSSAGANKNSYFLYPKTKGQVEEEIQELGFERYSIYRPAVLMCNRTEGRLGEKILRGLMNLDFMHLASVQTSAVAKSMVSNLFSPCTTKVEIFDNKQINQMAQSQMQTKTASTE